MLHLAWFALLKAFSTISLHGAVANPSSSPVMTFLQPWLFMCILQFTGEVCVGFQTKIAVYYIQPKNTTVNMCRSLKHDFFFFPLEFINILLYLFQNLQDGCF